MDDLITIEIRGYILDEYDYDDDKVSSMSLGSLMSLVNMKDSTKWDYFKLKLREAGYII